MCVDTINAYRKSVGLPPFARWTDEESCADGEAASDGASKVAHGDAFQCQELSQNECPGDSQSGQVYYPAPASESIPKCLELMWSQPAGEGHHDNMASTKWTKVACGFATLSNGAVWSVQNFR
jgi:hypothetical protein